VLEGHLSPDETIAQIFTYCTTCEQCQVTCASNYGLVHPRSYKELVDIYIAFRNYLKEYNPETFKDYVRIKDNTLKTGNPYGEEYNRFANLKEVLNPTDSAETLLFFGCTSTYRTDNIARATASVFNKLDLPYNIIDEICCSSPIFRTGFVEEAISLMEKNKERIEESGCQELVTTCPGCYSMLDKYYRNVVGLDIEVKHASQFLLEKFEERNVWARMDGFKHIVTFHDPCHLGRAMGVYEEPREILRQIPMLELEEMDRTRENSRCCGGGGGFRASHPEEVTVMAGRRLEDGERTRATVMASWCPNCIMNLRFGKKYHPTRMEIKDVMEILDEVIRW
jgi:Fe-S oxidoreductase